MRLSVTFPAALAVSWLAMGMAFLIPSPLRMPPRTRMRARISMMVTSAAEVASPPTTAGLQGRRFLLDFQVAATSLAGTYRCVIYLRPGNQISLEQGLFADTDEKGDEVPGTWRVTNDETGNAYLEFSIRLSDPMRNLLEIDGEEMFWRGRIIPPATLEDVFTLADGQMLSERKKVGSGSDFIREGTFTGTQLKRMIRLEELREEEREKNRGADEVVDVDGAAKADRLEQLLDAWAEDDSIAAKRFPSDILAVIDQRGNVDLPGRGQRQGSIIRKLS